MVPENTGVDFSLVLCAEPLSVTAALDQLLLKHEVATFDLQKVTTEGQCDR